MQTEFTGFWPRFKNPFPKGIAKALVLIIKYKARVTWSSGRISPQTLRMSGTRLAISPVMAIPVTFIMIFWVRGVSVPVISEFRPVMPVVTTFVPAVMALIEVTAFSPVLTFALAVAIMSIAVAMAVTIVVCCIIVTLPLVPESKQMLLVILVGKRIKHHADNQRGLKKI